MHNVVGFVLDWLITKGISYHHIKGDITIWDLNSTPVTFTLPSNIEILWIGNFDSFSSISFLKF